MLLLDPGRTPYDLRFSVAGIPVRVHPLFWLVAFLLGYQPNNARAVLIWIGVQFVSVLVHEFGHAWVMRRYGFAPRIVLYSAGGLAIPEENEFTPDFMRAQRDAKAWILITLAGPGAGFLLAALTAIVVRGSGGAFWFDVPSLESPIFWKFALPDAARPELYMLVGYLFFINIFWGLMNLLPILPLDGGQIARELLQTRGQRTGLRAALQLSVVVGGIAAAMAFFSLRDSYVGTMFLLLAVSNYMTLQQMGPADPYAGSYR